MAADCELVWFAIRLQIDKELGFFFFKFSSSSDGGKTVCCMMAVHSGFKLVATSCELIIILRDSGEAFSFLNFKNANRSNFEDYRVTDQVDLLAAKLVITLHFEN